MDAQTSPASDPIQDFIALPQDKQLSTLKALTPDKQDALLAQVKQRQTAPATPSPSWLDQAKQTFHGVVDPIQQSFDKETQTNPKEPLLETGLKRVVGAVGSPFVHPVATAEAFSPQSPVEAIAGPAGTAVRQLYQRGKEAVQDYKQGGLPYAATKLGGDIVGGVALGEAGGALPDAVSGAASMGKDILTGGTKAAKDLNASTVEANTTGATKAQNAAVAAQDARMKELNDHFQAIQSAKGDAPSTVGTLPGASTDATGRALDENGKPIRNAKELQSHKEALQRGVEQLDTKFQDDLKSTARDAKTQLDNKYATVRSALDAQTDPTTGELTPAPVIPSSDLAASVKNAEAHLMGSTENIKQFHDILSKHPEDDPDFVTLNEGGSTKIPRGHPLYDIIKNEQGGSTGATFRDLQGYYSELGDKLSTGGLQGDVYQAMKSLHDDIGQMMQKMADANGVGKQLADAQSYARDYYQTWRDSQSPLYKAIKAPERGQAIAQFQGKDQTGIGALARYNPELAKRANTIRAYQQQAASIPNKPFVEKPVSNLAPSKPPTPFSPQTIGPEDIQAANQSALGEKAQAAHSRSFSRMASGLAAFDIIRNALHGNWEGAGIDIAARGGLAAAQYGFGKLLENPKVVDYLSKPTPAQMAAIDPAVARGMQPLISAAKAKGIKISPALSAAISAHSTKTNWYDQPNTQ